MFAAHASIGQRFLAQFDIAYYLVFAGHVLITATYAPVPTWAAVTTAAQLQAAALRPAGSSCSWGRFTGHPVAPAVLQ